MKKLFHICGATATIAAVLALLSIQAVSQTPPPPPKGAPAGGASQTQTNQGQPIRVKVELVSAPVVVRDDKGEIVVDLEQKDFRLFDNGTEQTIDHFDMGSDPLSIVLLVETSSHVSPMLPAIQKSGIVFAENIVGEFDEAAVIAFGTAVERLQDFTGDRDHIEKVIKNLQDGGGQSKLYDAMGMAVRMLGQCPADRRRVIVVISEATDRGSEAKLGAVLQQAELENITIFSVGLSSTAADMRSEPKNNMPASGAPPGIYTGAPIPGEPQSPTTPSVGQEPGGSADILALGIWAVKHGENIFRGHPLEVAAAGTGGEHIATMRDRGIEAALDRIGGELHAQYTLSYHPTGNSPDGYHEIRVQVDRPNTTVRTRPGYYLPIVEGNGKPN
ncbi:MAG TPA: VWA domain-containing protein [Candidatus Acidoferrum sp.]|nr:VWA domain-containing protein [Candidatus Acidoferrum sp.]